MNVDLRLRDRCLSRGPPHTLFCQFFFSYYLLQHWMFFWQKRSIAGRPLRRRQLCQERATPRKPRSSSLPFIFFCLFLWVDGLAEKVVQSFVRAYARKRAFLPRDEKENCVRRQLGDGVRNLLDLFQFSGSCGETRERTGNPWRTARWCDLLGQRTFSILARCACSYCYIMFFFSH